jgi:transcriptional regulator with XRE-family HTH domain
MPLSGSVSRVTTTPTLNSAIATEVRVTLARANITQEVLARQCGWTPSSFSRRMTGEIPFSTDDIDAIAKALGIERDQLLQPRQARAAS